MGTADLPDPAQLSTVIARMRALARTKTHSVRESLALVGTVMKSLESDADLLQMLFDRATEELRSRAEKIGALEAELEAAAFVVGEDEEPTPPPQMPPIRMRAPTPPPPRRDRSTSMMNPDEMRRLGQQLIDAASQVDGVEDIDPMKE